MAEKQNDKSLDMRKITMAVNMLLLLCGLVYAMVVTISGYNGRLWYKLSLMILMMGYSLLFNIAALYAMNAFDNMTRQQGRSYFGYMIFDVVELCFLAMFVVNVGDFDEPFHYMALGVFLILTIPRHMLYHSAVDSIKDANGGRLSNLYNTVTGMNAYKNSGKTGSEPVEKAHNPVRASKAPGFGKKAQKGTDLAKKNKADKEAFPKPELREDRFVKMKLDKIEGYVDTRSVDDKGNVDVGSSRKIRN